MSHMYKFKTFQNFLQTDSKHQGPPDHPSVFQPVLLVPLEVEIRALPVRPGFRAAFGVEQAQLRKPALVEGASGVVFGERSE